MAGTHFAYPGKDGQAEFTLVASYTYQDKCLAPGIEPGHGQPSHSQYTNRLTSTIETNSLPLHHQSLAYQFQSAYPFR